MALLIQTPLIESQYLKTKLNKHALNFAKQHQATYIPPFDSPYFMKKGMLP